MPMNQPNLNNASIAGGELFSEQILPILAKYINLDKPLFDQKIYKNLFNKKQEKLEEIKKLVCDLYVLQIREDF